MLFYAAAGAAFGFLLSRSGAADYGFMYQRQLTDPENMLTTGIEVEARPPGKNVRKLSLLSGGERSLVALAFLFSIFRSRPSPFYLLHEVEARIAGGAVRHGHVPGTQRVVGDEPGATFR